MLQSGWCLRLLLPSLRLLRHLQGCTPHRPAALACLLLHPCLLRPPCPLVACPPAKLPSCRARLPAHACLSQVPWGAKETVLGMVAWSAAFVGVGLAFIPVLRAVAGPDGFSGLTATDKSVFALVNQVGGGLVISSLGAWHCRCAPPGHLHAHSHPTARTSFVTLHLRVLVPCSPCPSDG